MQDRSNIRTIRGKQEDAWFAGCEIFHYLTQMPPYIFPDQQFLAVLLRDNGVTKYSQRRLMVEEIPYLAFDIVRDPLDLRGSANQRSN